MRTDQIKIKGIDRHANYTDSPEGSCEELINVRAEENNLKIIESKKVVSANLPYSDILIHTIGTFEIFVGIKEENGVKSVVSFNKDTGQVIQSLQEFANHEIYLKTLNNMLVISDRTAIENYIYVYKDGKYDLFYDGIYPVIELTYNIENVATGTNDNVQIIEFVPLGTDKEYLAGVRNGINKYLSDNKRSCEGFILVATNLTLFDNTETKLSNLQLIDLSSEGENVFTSVIGGSNDTTADVRLYTYKNFFQIKVTLSINKEKDFKDLIKSINLYASRPISKYDFEKSYVKDYPSKPNGNNAQVAYPSTSGYLRAIMTKNTLKQIALPKQLLYKQKTWTLEELKKGITYTLEFGGDIQTTNKTLEVENSQVIRAGKMFLYNNRLHFYNSRTKFSFSENIFDYFDEGNLFSGNILIYLRESAGDVIIKKENVQMRSVTRMPPYVLALKKMIIFPDSRAYKIVFTQDDYVFELSLVSSETYNYSYSYTDDLVCSMIQNSQYSNVQSNNTYEENDALNVTASGNPIVFPVEHSYRFDGDIVGLGIGIEQISDAQIGQYPVNVFTNRGIYALQQGSGAILYSNIVPLNTDSCDSDKEIIQTRNGLVYVANNGIYLLYGRRNIKISLPLEGPIDTDVQNNRSYALCCQNDKLYDVGDYLSKVPFTEFLKGANLSFCAATEELIVSNVLYKYSYVYSFLYKTWYKIGDSYSGISKNLLLRPVFVNNATSTQATGEILLTNLIMEPAKVFNSYAKCSFSANLSCNAGDKWALVIDNKQISSATFSYITQFNIIVSVLCNSISYIEDFTSNNTVTIYTNLSSLVGKVLSIKNLTSNIEYSATLQAGAENVNVPDKGIGESISFDIHPGPSENGTPVIIEAYSVPIEAGDSIITMASKIGQRINNQSPYVSAMVQGNKILLTAKEIGEKGNKISVKPSFVDMNTYYQIQCSGNFTGGKDLGLEASNYNEIVDFSTTTGGNRVIHIQTRPIAFGSANVYKMINRMILNCRASLNSMNNLSVYIYCSNDLIDWKCYAGAQKTNCNISSIRLNRIARSFRYFMIMIGGIVDSQTNISNLIAEIEDKLSIKIR